MVTFEPQVSLLRVLGRDIFSFYRRYEFRKKVNLRWNTAFEEYFAYRNIRVLLPTTEKPEE